MARVLGKSLLGILISLVASGSGMAQNEAFTEGVKLYRLGKLEEALAQFESAITADPTNEQAFELWRTTDHAVWQALLLEQGEISKVAQHLLNLATMGRKERSRDEAAIAELVAQATSGDFGQRSKARLQLIADHGEFAVPALVEKLGDEDDDTGQINAMQVLEHLGRSATLPLIAALATDSELARRNIAAVLVQVGDERAAPAIAQLATTDTSDGVRMAAGEGLRKLGLTGSAVPADLYMAAARRYLTRSGIRPGESSDVVWSFADGALVATDTPGAVYHLELAKQAAHQALALAPSSLEARAIVTGSYLAEAAAIADSAAANPDDEALAALAAQVPALQLMAAGTGLNSVRRAVNDAIAADMVPTAVAGIQLLGVLENRSSLASTPLVAALDVDDRRIAYAAALALTSAAAGGAVPAAARVVDRLANAVTEEAIMTIKVIDVSPATERAVQDTAFRRGFRKSVSDSAVGAMDDLYASPDVDVVVINEILPDALPEAIIGLIRGDARMANTKILVLAKDADAAAERFGDRINGTIAGPLSAENLLAAVEAALADVEPGPRRARANKMAVSASHALEQLAQSQVDVSAAIDNLVAQLNRADDVAIPAAVAIGAGGELGEVTALIGVLQSDAASLDLKVACAGAAGEIFSRAGGLDQVTVDALLAIVASDADMQLRAAVVGALGKSRLGTDNEMKLINALKVRPGAAG